MTDTIPATLMRSGTSRGLYLLADDLPLPGPERDALLLALMGSGAANQIDGVGGGITVSNKIAIVSRSADPQADVDFLFAQVDPHAGTVDYGPTCGNVLTGVAPFAIERGLVAAGPAQTKVHVRLVNTGGVVEACVQTPRRRVIWDGDTRLDGVPESGAPIALAFLDCVGSKTGSMLPSGKRIEHIDGVPVTLVDAAMPMMIVAAASLGLAGSESADELDANEPLRARLESLRIEAGRRMGLGDVSGRVVPKIALVAAPQRGGSIRSRYFTPWRTHPSHAVTGAIAVAVAARIPGTVAHAVAAPGDGAAAVEHAAGVMHIALTTGHDGDGQPRFDRAGVVRTARPIFTGHMHVARRREPVALAA